MEKSREENPKQGVAASAAAPPPPTAGKDGPIPADKPKPLPIALELFVKAIKQTIRFMVTFFILTTVWDNIFLSFKIDSVSVSIHEDPGRSNVTAVWDIGFSTLREVRDLNVSVRFMSRDFQLETRYFQGKTVYAENRNATVSMVLPTDFVALSYGELVLEQVMFECYFRPRYDLKAACQNVAVEYSRDEAKWILKGGPKSCPFVRYGSAYFFSYEVSFDKIFSYVFGFDK